MRARGPSEVRDIWQNSGTFCASRANTSRWCVEHSSPLFGESFPGLIGETKVPQEDVSMETKAGKRRTVKRRLYPGYIMVEVDIPSRSMIGVRCSLRYTRYEAYLGFARAGAKRATASALERRSATNPPEDGSA